MVQAVRVREIRNEIHRILIETRVKCNQTEECTGQLDVLYEYFTRIEPSERLKTGPVIERANMRKLPLCPECRERLELDENATSRMLRRAEAWVEREGVTPRRC